jgi:predicted TIM-barrel fold metal-dependent hydrolase
MTGRQDGSRSDTETDAVTEAETGTQADIYRGPVLDAHFHLWSLAGDHYPWLRPSGQLGRAGVFDSLKHDYLLADYRRDIAGQGVVASVHIEALWDPTSDPVDETRWLEGLDHSDGLAARYVAAAPFGLDSTADILHEQAAFDRVVAIRQVVAWNPDPNNSMTSTPHLVRDEQWQQALPVLEELGLHLELLIYSWQADEVAELALAHPGLTVVIDHVAGPVDQTPDGVARWRDGVAALASAPNVVIKLSSIHGYLSEPTQAATSAVVQTVVEAFGPNRAMFASDFPVAGMRLSFDEIYSQYRRSVVHLPARDQHALFYGTAARVYRVA